MDYRERQRMFRYVNIENSAWYKALTQNSSERHRINNKLRIYFQYKEDVDACVTEAKRRNISHCSGYNFYTAEYSVDIMMNWSEDRPTRIKRKEELILN